MGEPYNGYTWDQRKKILQYEKRLRREDPLNQRAYLLRKIKKCEICDDPGDPENPHTQWHSEDYSQPFSLRPPQTFVLCNVCHSRIHKRFPDKNGKASDWKVFLAHLRSGGYGREFTQYPRATRVAWQVQIEEGQTVTLQSEHKRQLTGMEWWQTLTLDPESLLAPWARPRPWRERPSTENFRTALEKIHPTEREWALLKTHANFPRRCASMRQLAKHALSSEFPATANLAYGNLAHKLADALNSIWLREHPEDDWMSLVAEGWRPVGREYEWVMVPTLALVFTAAVSN